MSKTAMDLGLNVLLRVVDTGIARVGHLSMGRASQLSSKTPAHEI
jgi:hypothetical protein